MLLVPRLSLGTGKKCRIAAPGCPGADEGGGATFSGQPGAAVLHYYRLTVWYLHPVGQRTFTEKPAATKNNDCRQTPFVMDLNYD